jgi:hypothetical protein
LAGVGVLLLIVAAIIFGPLLTIWAINTLFGTQIPFTLSTWFAALLLGGCFYPHKRKAS